MRSSLSEDWRPLLFAFGALLVIVGLAAGTRAEADSRVLQTIPTATPRITLPPPTDTPLPGETPVPDPTGAPPTPLPTGTGPATDSLEVTKEASPSDVLAGDEAVFRIRLSNDHETAVTGIVVADSLDPALEPQQVSATQGFAEVDGQSLAIHIGTLESGESAVIVIRTRVRASAQQGQVILNWAIAYHDTGQTVSNTVAIALPPNRLPDTGAIGRRP